MVQKNLPFINKTGYSMFWNSMWDNNKNYSRFLQKDFFTKNFVKSFFSDYFFNQIFYKFNFNNTNNINFNLFYKNPKLINLFFEKNQEDLYISKIWFFRYQNWIIIYFNIFSKEKIENEDFFNKNTYYFDYINNYIYNNNFKKNIFNKKNNFFKNNF